MTVGTPEVPIPNDQPDGVGQTIEPDVYGRVAELNLVKSDVSSEADEAQEPLERLRSMTLEESVAGTNMMTSSEFKLTAEGRLDEAEPETIANVAAKKCSASYGLLPPDNQLKALRENLNEEHENEDAFVDEDAVAEAETEKQAASDNHLSAASQLPLLENVDKGDEEVECLAKEEENEEGWSATLTENIYSLIYAADPRTLTFYFALFLFGFQSSLMVLALIDMIKLNSGNPLGVPADVTAEVRAAQYFAVTLAIPLFGDLLGSVEALHEGYDRAILKQTRHATHWKWVLAFTLQFVVGMLYLVTTFILVVQSDRVISMLLNFAALGFISEIDDLAFLMARKGYVTEGVKRQSEVVLSLRTPDVKDYIFRRVAFLLTWIGLIAGLSVVFYRQLDRQFQCQKIHAQFGDAFINYLPIYSGEYEIAKKSRMDGRPVYVSKGQATTVSHFRYCESETAWIFIPNTPLSQSNCRAGTWELKSPETRGFDLTETEDSQWLTRTSEPGDELLRRVDYLTLRCNDCDETTCNGVCDRARNVCECTDGTSFGLGCQFVTQPCEKLEYDHRTAPFRNTTGLPAPSSTYDLLVDFDMNPVLAYGHPVYFSLTYDDPEKMYFGIVADILIHVGRRYVATFFVDLDIYEIPFFSEEAVLLDLVEFISEGDFKLVDEDWNSTHPQALYPPSYISDPMDFGTASDSDSPAGLHWYLTQNIFSNDFLTPGPGVDTVLLCSGCFEGNNCIWGFCNNVTKECDCEDAFEGPHCEVESVRVAEPWCESCQEGYCRSETRTCDCHAGYEGENCTDLTSWCAGCQSGSCDVETETCVCYQGYEGENCTIVAPWCEACSPDHSLYCDSSTSSCVCDDGYAGETCEDKADWCIPCSPYGGHCVASSESCECYEFGGYEGDNCDIPLPWCVGCSFEGGFCNGKTKKCECFDGYEGEKCDVMSPWCEVCLFGSCNGDTQSCDCSPGYEGENCDVTLSWCEACSENEICNAVNKTCDCRVGYEGELCDIPLKWCEGCSQIGGRCDDEKRSCVCNPGYIGVDCDTEA